MADLTAIDRLEIETRPYCVHIADGNGASLGSGLLYYPGAGDKLYVFTCAHVVDNAETLTLSILLPEEPEHDQYGLRQWIVSAEQIYYSPP